MPFGRRRQSLLSLVHSCSHSLGRWRWPSVYLSRSLSAHNFQSVSSLLSSIAVPLLFFHHFIISVRFKSLCIACTPKNSTKISSLLRFLCTWSASVCRYMCCVVHIFHILFSIAFQLANSGTVSVCAGIETSEGTRDKIQTNNGPRNICDGKPMKTVFVPSHNPIRSISGSC